MRRMCSRACRDSLARATCRRLRQSNPTGKSPKVCPALRAKIFRLPRRANHAFNSRSSTATRGAIAIVTNVRWDAVDVRSRLTSAAYAYGEIVWVRRPGAGVKFGGSESFQRRWWQQSRSPGRPRISRKAIAQGRPECSPLNLYARGQHIFCATRLRDRGCSAHPVFPAPSLFQRARRNAKLRAEHAARMRPCCHRPLVRDCALGRVSRYSETSMMESIGRGVLDTPPARGRTAVCGATTTSNSIPRDDLAFAVVNVGRVEQVAGAAAHQEFRAAGADRVVAAAAGGGFATPCLPAVAEARRCRSRSARRRRSRRHRN